MAINTNGLSSKNNNRNNNLTDDSRPKAKVWANIGYTVDTVYDDSGENISRFVSLPVNLAIDTMDQLKINSQNQSYNDFQSARNSLLDQLLEKANELQPGESTIVNLEVQLFRSNQQVEPTSSENNKFALRRSL